MTDPTIKRVTPVTTIVPYDVSVIAIVFKMRWHQGDAVVKMPDRTPWKPAGTQTLP